MRASNGRRWYQRRRVHKADALDIQAERAMASRLTLEEIAHFRAGVAQQYSRSLRRSEAATNHVLDAMDAIVGNLGPLQPALEGMLLHQDAKQRADVLAVKASVTCPKLGVLAHVGAASGSHIRLSGGVPAPD